MLVSWITLKNSIANQINSSSRLYTCPRSDLKNTRKKTSISSPVFHGLSCRLILFAVGAFSANTRNKTDHTRSQITPGHEKLYQKIKCFIVYYFLRSMRPFERCNSRFLIIIQGIKTPNIVE